ncbi:MGMT family protein [Bacillus massiliglaciei]|uniref:MGMT family protein n=1 Tax=Bacillus massiliglaciei TaxID=1816693 RepID=UPI000AF0C574|nr:MGMT family protein [Bacillus massiliglaciei]
MKAFTERVIEIIQKIPEGEVATYGQVARMAGSPRGARQVVRILHSCSDKYDLPWHRVVNKKGEIAIQDPLASASQLKKLKEEGVSFLSDKAVNLNAHQFDPLQDF